MLFDYPIEVPKKNRRKKLTLKERKNLFRVQCKLIQIKKR